jgi:hypothetical protein
MPLARLLKPNGINAPVRGKRANSQAFRLNSSLFAGRSDEMIVFPGLVFHEEKETQTAKAAVENSSAAVLAA